MVMFLIFLFTDLFIAGIFYAVYGKKRTYTEGMLLGVHLPASAAESGEVVSFMERYHRKTKAFFLMNTLAGALICGICFWYFSVFMIVWCVWLAGFSVGMIALLFRNHRKLYDLKVERGWIGSEGSRIMAADVKVAAQSDRMGLSPLWHLAAAFLILMPCVLPTVRYYLRVSDDGMILFGCSLAVTASFAILHKVILGMRNRVYSEDSDLNMKVNRMQKTVWSWALIGAGFCNAAAYLTAASSMDTDGRISTGVYIVYVVLESLPGAALICGFLYMRFKKEKMLAGNRHPLYIDDDVYWKNGWYSNPNDRRLIVQDWVCSWNYTTNMARPLGKFCLLLGVGVTAAVMIWGCREMWKMDFAPIRMEITGEGLEITSGVADYSIRYDEIESVRLLESLPEEDYAGYRLIKGSDSAGKLAGRFRGKETGACRLYIYKGYEPVLEIDTKEGPVYVNSRNEGEAEKWNEKLKKM